MHNMTSQPAAPTQFDLDYAGSRMLRRLFATSEPSPGHCASAAAPVDCAFCLFPLLSTFISSGFSAVYLAAFMVVTQRIIGVVINKALARRVRCLQLLTAGWLAASLACRGCTVLFQPFELGFEALRLAHVVCVAGLVGSLE
jgi:hypothetical protein